MPPFADHGGLIEFTAGVNDHTVIYTGRDAYNLWKANRPGKFRYKWWRPVTYLARRAVNRVKAHRNNAIVETYRKPIEVRYTTNED